MLFCDHCGSTMEIGKQFATVVNRISGAYHLCDCCEESRSRYWSKVYDLADSWQKKLLLIFGDTSE